MKKIDDSDGVTSTGKIREKKEKIGKGVCVVGGGRNILAQFLILIFFSFVGKEKQLGLRHCLPRWEEATVGLKGTLAIEIVS